MSQINVVPAKCYKNQL